MLTDHSGPILAERDGLTVLSCQKCGFAHLATMPTEAELDKFYTSDFWQTYKRGALAHIEEQADWLAAVYGDWLSVVEDSLPIYSGSIPWRGSLLDVGCGYGHFMAEAALRSWIAWGLELSEDCIAYVDKNKLTNKSRVHQLSWTQFPSKSPYHCLSALWVLEHLPNPADFLRWAATHLVVGGVLLLAVPNEFTNPQCEANERVQRKNYFVDRTHMNYFTDASLSNLLGRHGFRVVERLASYPMENFILEADMNYVDNPAVGHKAHKIVEVSELAMTRAERLAEYRERARRGYGRDLILVAVKE